MAIKDRALAFNRKFKLDSHHAIERFGVFVCAFALIGLAVMVGSGASAYRAGEDSLSSTALYSTEFTTSKTRLKGSVDGVYTNRSGTRALVMMHFPQGAAISYNAADYRAFLLGSTRNLASEPVSTPGVNGAFYAFGSTGYVGVLLEADQAFDRQVLNLTVRATKELSYKESQTTEPNKEMADDATFQRYDQWRVFFNPGASGAIRIGALDAAAFDPTRAYYDIVVQKEEAATRDKLDQKLIELRANLARIEAYTADLQTTKVDGIFLRPPSVPASITGDQVTGSSAGETRDGRSTLRLETRTTVPGGFDFDWRAGTVYDGYLNTLVPTGQSYVQYLTDKRKEGSAATNGTNGTSSTVANMEWKLSDGSDLKKDYRSSDTAMRPLTNVMNNLSQAYTDYLRNKAKYQSDLMLELLSLDVKLRDVQANSTVNDRAEFLTTLR